MTQDTEDVVAAVARALYVHFEHREPVHEPRGDWLVAAGKAIEASGRQSLSGRIDALEGVLEEAGKAFKRLADGEVGQPENLAFNGWQMIVRVMEQGK